jgi:AAA domain
VRFARAGGASRVTTAAEIASVLERSRKSGRGFTASCPAHDDSVPSLSIADGEVGPVVHCHAGCEQSAVLDALAAHGIDLRKPRANGHDRKDFGVAALAAAKRLEPHLLRDWNVRDEALGNGSTAVAFEYRDAADKITGVKFRRSLDGNRGFFWQKGSKPGLYGLWRLADMRALDNRLVICEGETDTLTLWQRDFSALGLPGASMWREEWLAKLPESDPIYVIIEPDRGGVAVKDWLGKSDLRHRARMVQMPVEHKDPSALYLADPNHFVDRFEALLEAAKPWDEQSPSEPRIRLRQAAEIVAEPIPAAWLLRPYLEQMVLALLYGELGTLKSFVTLDMLLSIAAGKPWGGSPYRSKPQPVVYVSAEGRGLEKRLRAWALHHGVDLARIPFYAIEHALDLSKPDNLLELVEAIEALKIVPALVGIDTLSRNKGALDENVNSDMAAFLGLLDSNLRQRFKCSVLLVHHVGHGAKDRSRGAYSLMADTDANYLIERPDAQELTIRITTGRLKDSESPTPLYLKAHIINLGTEDADGQPETSLVLLPTDERPAEARKQPTGKQQLALLRLLEQEYAEGRTTWTTTDVRRLAKERLNMRASSAKSAQVGLGASGFLKATIGGVTLTDPPVKADSP